MTYDVSETETESEIGCDCVHEVEHVGLTHLVLILQVAVVEVLLDAPSRLGHLGVFRIHHQHSVEGAAVGKWVLALNHELACTSLTCGHEWCTVLVCHWVVAASHNLERRFELGWSRV